MRTVRKPRQSTPLFEARKVPAKQSPEFSASIRGSGIRTLFDFWHIVPDLWNSRAGL